MPLGLHCDIRSRFGLPRDSAALTSRRTESKHSVPIGRAPAAASVSQYENAQRGWKEL